MLPRREERRRQEPVGPEERKRLSIQRPPPLHTEAPRRHEGADRRRHLHPKRHTAVRARHDLHRTDSSCADPFRGSGNLDHGGAKRVPRRRREEAARRPGIRGHHDLRDEEKLGTSRREPDDPGPPPERPTSSAPGGSGVSEAVRTTETPASRRRLAFSSPQGRRSASNTAPTDADGSSVRRRSRGRTEFRGKLRPPRGADRIRPPRASGGLRSPGRPRRRRKSGLRGGSPSRIPWPGSSP